MKKRIFILLIAALLVFPAAAFGSNLLGFRIGPTAMVDLGNSGDWDERDGVFDLDWEDKGIYSFGADARFNFTLIELGLLAQITLPEDDSDVWFIDALPTVGVAFPFASVLRLGAGIGPNLSFAIGEDADDDNEGVVEDALDASLSMRATADLSLGNIVLSVYGLLNSSTSFNDIADEDDDVKFMDMFKKPNFGMGASVLFSIF